MAAVSAWAVAASILVIVMNVAVNDAGQRASGPRFAASARLEAGDEVRHTVEQVSDAFEDRRRWVY